MSFHIVYKKLDVSMKKKQETITEPTASPVNEDLQQPIIDTDILDKAKKAVKRLREIAEKKAPVKKATAKKASAKKATAKKASEKKK